MPAQGPGFAPAAPSAWVVVAVLALHLLVLWSLHAATHRPSPTAPRPTRAVSVTLLSEAEAVPVVAPRQTRAPRASPAATPRRPREAKAHAAPPLLPAADPPPEPLGPSPHPAGAAAQATQTETDQPVAAAPPASSPLLDSAASRRAIRELARQRPITEQAALASATTRPAPGARLGERIREAGRGDCAKGDFAGAGMGLLSLPFLAAAAIRDECAQ
jgi:hypothetical protein